MVDISSTVRLFSTAMDPPTLFSLEEFHVKVFSNDLKSLFLVTLISNCLLFCTTKERCEVKVEVGSDLLPTPL